MSKKSDIQLLTEYIDAIKKVNSAWESFHPVIGDDPESPICRGLYILNEVCLKAVSEILGDECDWIDWFIWENDCGEKGYEAGFKDNLKKIKTIEDLYGLIKEEND